MTLFIQEKQDNALHNQNFSALSYVTAFSCKFINLIRHNKNPGKILRLCLSRPQVINAINHTPIANVTPLEKDMHLLFLLATTFLLFRETIRN